MKKIVIFFAFLLIPIHNSIAQDVDEDHQKEESNKAYDNIEATYDRLSTEEKARVRRLFDKRHSAYLSELDHHYVRAAILDYQLLDHIKSIFGTSVHNILVHRFQQGWYLKNTKDTTKIKNIVGESLKYAIFQNGRDKKRAGNKFNPLEAGSIAKAHQYGRRYSYFTIKDDSLLLLLKNYCYKEALELANRLLIEKENAFGSHHPAYALALSDLAWVCFHSIYYDGMSYSIYNIENENSLSIKALDYQAKAIKLYEELHLTSCHQLSARFYSEISYRVIKHVNIQNPETLDRIIQLKQKELDITQSILGNSANEVKAAKKELQLLFDYENDIKEDVHADIFAKGVNLYRKGNYKEAKEFFGTCFRKDKDSLEHSMGYAKRIWQKRLDYDHQWEFQCSFKYEQNLYDRYNWSKVLWSELQPPIDRTLTKDIDYIICVEDKSKTSYSKIIQMAERHLDRTSLDYAHLLVDAADFLSEKKVDITKAFEYYSKAAQIYKEKSNDNGIAYSYVMARLANLYFVTGNNSACGRSMNEVMDIVIKTGIDKSINVVNTIIKICDDANLHSIASHFYEKKYQILSDYWFDNQQKEIINTISKWSEHVAALKDTIHGKCGLERAFDIIDGFLKNNPYAPHGDSSKLLELVNYKHFILKQESFLDQAGHEKDAISFLRMKISEAKVESVRESLLARLISRNKASIEDINLFQKVIFMEKARKVALDYDDYEEEVMFGVSDIYYTLAMEHYYLQQNRLQDAEKIWRWPIAACSEGKIRLKGYKLPSGYSCHASMLQRHAKLLQRLNQKEDAAREMMECAELKTTDLLIELVMKNLQEREQYWLKQKVFFETSLPVFAYESQQPELLGILYNACLLSKGLLLNTEMEIARALSHQSDTTVLHKYQNLQNNRLLLTNQLELPERYRTMDTDSLRAVILALEHDLKYSLRNSGQVNVISSLRTSWKEVEQKLNESDAAVEFLSIPNGNDSIMYVALTLRKGSINPVMTTLFEEHQLKALSRKDIYETDALYRILWQPLEKELVGVKRLFFSPAGALHEMAIEYLPGMEKLKALRLSSTRELVIPQKNTFTKDVALYGGIQYELSEEERNTLQQNYSPSFRDMPDLRDFRGAAQRLPVLEGSRREVSDISNMMREKRIPTIIATGVNGSEESFKALSGQGKSIIHISTHGFYQLASEEHKVIQDDMMDFFDDSHTQEDRSLSRSGLLLAGAADYLRGSSVFMGGEDGILTSKEISRLDLMGLDLVVLSACETGLGDVTSEGVYGLQRGFKKAGAQTMLLSLWKVEDDATCILMTEFYRQLLDGKSKREAFVNAQQYLRRYDGGRFNRWECWAAFVLLDGME